jgi:Tol biopolymer transport system component
MGIPTPAVVQRCAAALPAAALLLVLAACDEPTAPRVGDLVVAVSTSGEDIDLDGYELTVSGTDARAVGPNQTLLVRDVPAGTRVVALSGVAENCTVAGGPVREVSVASGSSTSVTFAVTCAATGMHISTLTTGIDLAPGYTVSLNGGDPLDIGAVGTRRVTRLEPGSYTVALGGVPPNCTDADGALRVVEVSIGEVVPITFQLACVATAGSVRAAALTTGVDLAGQYTLQLGTGTPQPLPANSALVFDDVAAGEYTLRLNGVPANCEVAGGTERVIMVTAGGATRDTAHATFEVACVALTGAIAVSVETGGIDTDPDGYQVLVNGAAAGSLPPSGSLVLSGYGGGELSIGLTDIADNCAVTGDNPRTVTVTVGGATRDTAHATFDVACGAATASLHVTATTTGVDSDPDGYLLQLGDAAPVPLPVNGEVTIDGLAGGGHVLTLAGVASHCTVAGSATVAFSVTVGGSVRDTARIDFSLGCARADWIAFTRASVERQLGLISSSGADTVWLGQGLEPAWSPDGARLVHVRYECYDYWYYPYCGRTGLAVREVGGGEVTLTSDVSDGQPAWSPDGTRIVFTRHVAGQQRLLLIAPSGASLGEIPTPGAQVIGQPAWSPDGTRIAFTCAVQTGDLDICVVGPDGSGLVRLTDTPGRDAAPSWHPDGTRIAFVTRRFGGISELAIMNADGSDVTRVLPNIGATQPSWSHDGARIVFSRFLCDVYGGCTVQGLFVIGPDGSGLTQLTDGRDHDPAWRP